MTNVRADIFGDPQRTVLNALLADGFMVLQERYDREAFGNCLIDVTTREVSVRIVRERGAWSIDASVPGWKEWFPISMWRWIYDGGDIPLEDNDFDEDARWLLGAIANLVADLREEPATVQERLRECGRARLAALIERSRPLDP